MRLEVGPAGAEVEARQAAHGATGDDVGHQDDARTFPRIRACRDGIEHHRKPVAVAYSADDGEDIAAALQCVQFDDGAALRQAVAASVGDEFHHARVCEYVANAV